MALEDHLDMRISFFFKRLVFLISRTFLCILALVIHHVDDNRLDTLEAWKLSYLND